MAEKKSCGRSADIFSLGCVLLEIIVVHRCGTLEHVRQNRSDDTCFHANLDRIDGWLRHSTQSPSSARENFINSELKRMLTATPSERPTISELLVSFSAADMASAQLDVFISIFGGCCENLLVTKKQHESQITQLRKDQEYQSKRMANKFDDMLEERKQDGTLFLNLHRSLNRLKDNYRKLEHSNRRSKASKDRVVEVKDADYFTQSWVDSQFEAMLINLAQSKEHFRDMEIHLTVDTTQSRILHNAATRDAQHEVSTRGTKSKYTNLPQADMAGRDTIQQQSITVLVNMERGLYIGMERMEDEFAELHEQAELVRRQLRQQAAFMQAQLDRDKSPQRKLKENAEDTGIERERVGVPDVELGPQETAEGHVGAREVVKKSQIRDLSEPPAPPPLPEDQYQWRRPEN